MEQHVSADEMVTSQQMTAEVDFWRHSGWVGPEDLTETLHIIGCGAVGSNVALLAAKMGFSNFVLWDVDTVENHNLANQAFDVRHVGMPKTEALKDVLNRFNPRCKVHVNNKFFTPASAEELSGCVVIAVDSMHARQTLADALNMNIEVAVAVDVRLGFDYGTVFTLDPLNFDGMQKYSQTIVSDDAVAESPCNLKICTTLVYQVTGYAVHMLCSRFSALRREEQWEYDQQAVFSLTNKLRTSTINR